MFNHTPRTPNQTDDAIHHWNSTTPPPAHTHNRAHTTQCTKRGRQTHPRNKSTLAHYRVLTQHTHTHQLSTPQPDAPACAASRNPNTTTSQTQTRATTGKQQTVKESPPQPPTQPTTGYKSFQLPGGCLGDDKKHYTPHPHTTNPQHTPTKHTNKHNKKGTAHATPSRPFHRRQSS